MALGLKKKAKPAPKVIAKPVTAPVTRSPSIQAVKINTAADKPAPEHKFTPRQALFMDSWMISRNATQAAREAGFSKKSAVVQGSRLYRNAHVRAELNRRIAAQRQKMQIDADWVIERLALIANGNPADYLSDGAPDLSGMTREQAYALGSVTVEEFKDGRSDKREVRRTKFTLGDREKCLELLGRNLKLFDDGARDQTPAMTIIEYMLHRIDKESRGKVIEHQK